MSEFYEGLAEIFEIDASQITPEYELGSGDIPWDSLAIVSTIAVVDDCFGVILDGKSLGECATVADIERLAAAAKGA